MLTKLYFYIKIYNLEKTKMDKQLLFELWIRLWEVEVNCY